MADTSKTAARPYSVVAAERRVRNEEIGRLGGLATARKNKGQKEAKRCSIESASLWKIEDVEVMTGYCSVCRKVHSSFHSMAIGRILPGDLNPLVAAAAKGVEQHIARLRRG